MVICEDHKAYPWDRMCSMCGRQLRGPVAVWPAYREGRDCASAACVCEKCCKAVASRAASDFQKISEIREIESMGFDKIKGRRWGTTLFVPEEITSH